MNHCSFLSSVYALLRSEEMYIQWIQDQGQVYTESFLTNTAGEVVSLKTQMDY